MGENASDGVFIAIVLGGAWLVGLVVMQRSTDLSRARQDIRARRSAWMWRLDVARAIASGMTNAEIPLRSASASGR